MPIYPVSRTDKAATRDTLAALLLVAWAFLRQRGDVASANLANEWDELRRALEDWYGPAS